MKKIVIEGGKRLSGTIEVAGAKNSAVALIPAAILSDGVVEIDNVPNISDIDALDDILTYLGASVERIDGSIKIDSSNVVNREIPENISSKLRASYYFMSALLGKYKHVEMYFPGGCSIGARPIDQTLKAFKLLGARVVEKDNKFTIDADELVGNTIYLDMPSVGATINTMFAAVRAKGITVIRNAAREPEIVNVATFLNNMGAQIIGAGTSKIRIVGVDHLSNGFAEVIPDRIEAGTYIIAGALIGDNLTIDNNIPEHIESLLFKFNEMGVKYELSESSITLSSSSDLKPTRVKTLGYPGFPTDLQQPLTVLLCMCNGVSKLEETIYENRFNNVAYLKEMGADINIVTNQKLEINGPTSFVGKNVVATDLRAGACMVLAGLVANGETVVSDVEHILRGYEDIIGKLSRVGAQIKLIEE